jgi:hypothetical protein
MTHQEIKELAGHRAVSPWVMKLVGDAVAKEREACAKIADEWAVGWPHPSQSIAEWIRKRT